MAVDTKGSVRAVLTNIPTSPAICLLMVLQSCIKLYATTTLVSNGDLTKT